jgi:hypothetical protein
MVSKSSVLLYVAIIGGVAGLAAYNFNKLNNPPPIVSEFTNLENKIDRILGSTLDNVTQTEVVDELPVYAAKLDSLKSISGVERQVEDYKSHHKMLYNVGAALFLGPLAYITAVGRKAFW